MPELYPEDQKRVDEYLARTTREERKPFKPLFLLFIILIVLGILTAISFYVGQSHGVV